MVRKKVEGDENQRRAAARQARAEGEAPSAQQETTGASKQRSHRSRHESHAEKMAALQQGKQGRPDDSEGRTSRPGADDEQDKRFADHEDYTDEHARVFSALADAQQAHDGAAVYLDEVARFSGLPSETTRALLHDLAVVHRLVTILQGADDPDLGPHFEVKPRL